MNSDITYDSIIYSAGLAGVITALKLSDRSKKILLLNYYGFTGGIVSESLSCLQSIDDKKSGKLTSDFFENIKKEKDGLLYRDKNKAIFNPESVKIVLQKLIEYSGVELLFHIVPFHLAQKENSAELSLNGKEGIIHLKARSIIDASDDYDLLKLENTKRHLNGLYYNMFLTGIMDDSWQDYDLLNNKFSLSDGRYWISLKLPKPGNEYFIENNSQKIINEFEEIVQKCGGRIQLLAPQTHKVYDVERTKISDNIFHIDSLLSDKYNFDEVLLKSSELEDKLNNTDLP